MYSSYRYPIILDLSLSLLWAALAPLLLGATGVTVLEQEKIGGNRRKYEARTLPQTTKKREKEARFDIVLLLDTSLSKILKQLS